MRLRAVVKLWSANETKLPIERVCGCHLWQRGQQHLMHALRTCPIKACLDKSAADPMSPASRRDREHPELGLVRACRKLPQWRCGRTPRDRAKDAGVVDRHHEYGLASSSVGVGQPCLILVVDQAVPTTQQVVGVITLGRNLASLGILAG